MATGWLSTTTPRTQPFSLRIEGLYQGVDLLSPRTARKSTNRPYAPLVLPDSISLNQTADDLGGSLTFTVLQEKTPVLGPWWSRDVLPDNALVTFSQNQSVDGTNSPQTRLFAGFIDNLESTMLPGGAGSSTTVTCVSLSSVLDRIVVRKITNSKRGTAVNKILIPSGTDRYQIRKILELVGGKRQYGSSLVFNPTNVALIEETATALPQLEVQLGTLRQALESNQTALKATEAGYEVGTRTAVDVLEARRSLTQAQTNYSRSRYDYILNVLRLRFASGTLDRATLEEVNTWLTEISRPR